MKLLVFAHTPPPFHGQSYMVQLMIEGFGGDIRDQKNTSASGPIQVYHVNARFSDGIDDIGGIRPGKLFKLFRYCLQAILTRFQYGEMVFYYVPAPPKRSALYRDWLILFLCRPFFKKIVFHWEAMGLGEWLARSASNDPTLPNKLKAWEIALTKKILSGVDLSIALTQLGADDCAHFQPKRIEIVPNGIADPCPDFDQALLPLRKDRFQTCSWLRASTAGSTSPGIFRVLFMAHCTREKGLFDAIEALSLANEQLAQENSALHLELTVAGDFMNPGERQEFDERIQRSDLFHSGRPTIHYAGFVSGTAKDELLRISDCLCFPTYYSGEAFPVLLIEALAWGLGIVSTQWRGIPDILGSAFPLVPPRDPLALSQALRECLLQPNYEEARALFLARYTHHHYQQGLAKAITSF